MVQQLGLFDQPPKPAPAPSKDNPSDSWGNVTQFHGGYCYGVGVTGESVCCGTEDQVKEAIAKRLRCGIPEIDRIIALERKLIAQGVGEKPPAKRRKAPNPIRQRK